MDRFTRNDRPRRPRYRRRPLSRSHNDRSVRSLHHGKSANRLRHGRSVNRLRNEKIVRLNHARSARASKADLVDTRISSRHRTVSKAAAAVTTDDNEQALGLGRSLRSKV